MGVGCAVYKSFGEKKELSLNGSGVGNGLVIFSAFPSSLRPVGSSVLAALCAYCAACPAGRCCAVLGFKDDLHFNGFYLFKIILIEHRIDIKINLGNICTVLYIYL